MIDKDFCPISPRDKNVGFYARTNDGLVRMTRAWVDTAELGNIPPGMSLPKRLIAYGLPKGFDFDPAKFKTPLRVVFVAIPNDRQNREDLNVRRN